MACVPGAAGPPGVPAGTLRQQQPDGIRLAGISLGTISRRTRPGRGCDGSDGAFHLRQVGLLPHRGVTCPP
jgi:hypothetical protein